MSDQVYDPCVKVSWDDAIATITLARPKSLNSISVELIEDFNTAVDEVIARRPRARALIVTGEGRAFCAGGDISAHSNRPADAEPYDLEAALRDLFNPLLLRLLNLRIPFVVAVNGAAAGAGFPLAICGDVVVAGQSAAFESGFPSIGLVPDLGLTWFLPNLIGRARAHSVLMLGERVSAQKAAEWGMIHACVEDDALQDEAKNLAKRMAASSIPALVGTRKLILEALGAPLEHALDREAWEQRSRGYSGDFKEGIEAFFGKRRPDFKDY